MKRLSLILLIVLTFFVAAGSAQNLTIGMTVSKTGALNVDSLEQYRGFELWRDQVNSAGGIKAGGKSYKIQFVSYDDESNSKRVQQLYSRMILQDNADFLFSPYSSPLTATAAVVTEQYGKIMLTTGAAEGKTYTLGNHYLFQMFAPGAEYLKGALDMLKTKDPKATVAFVYEDASFSVSVVNPAKAYAQQLGFNVVFSEAYAPNTTDFSAIIDKVIASKATVLLGGGHYADGSTLARQLYGHKVPLKMITLLVAPDSPQWTELGDAAAGRDCALAVGTADGVQGAIRAQWCGLRQSLHREVQRSAELRISRRLRLRPDSATRHRAGWRHGHGQSGECAERDRHYDVLRAHQVFHRGQRPWSASGTRHGPGPVAKGQIRQAGEASGLAAGGQERQPGVSDPLNGARNNPVIRLQRCEG